jgi:isopenicillin N synthase-like dioxygenase
MEAGPPQIIAKSATTFLHSSEVVARLARKALQLSLNASTAELDEFIDTVAGGLRLAYYPAQLEPPLPGQMRYGAHVDSGGITVISLDTSNTGGLQVDLGGSGVAGSEEQRVWVDVPFVPGSLVLNVGALLSRWTAGRWKASVHRVLTDNTQMERLSIITSVLSPRIDGPAFGGFQSVVNENGQPPVRAADYLANRVALHRPEYKTEKGLLNEELMAKESERIQMLSI